MQPVLVIIRPEAVGWSWLLRVGDDIVRRGTADSLEEAERCVETSFSEFVESN